jgi:hypothetical protein
MAAASTNVADLKAELAKAHEDLVDWRNMAIGFAEKLCAAR